MMYIVLKNYVKYLLFYDGCLLKELVEGEDYIVFYGEIYYDSIWWGFNGEEGVMMEFYKKVSLFIFLMENKYSFVFIFLGNKVYYFIFDDKLDDIDLLLVCFMLLVNYFFWRDFIKYFLYSLGDSERFGGCI